MNRKYRIKKNDDFQLVFKKGKSMANRQFVVYKLEKDLQGEFRIGLSVSKKVGNAVTRNRIKRYIRQFFLENKSRIKPNFDYVIIARIGASTIDYEQAVKSLFHVLGKSKSISD